MTLSTPERHQLKIARDTLKMHCIGARIMGGMGDAPHKRAAEIIRELTGKNPRLDPECSCFAEYDTPKLKRAPVVMYDA